MGRFLRKRKHDIKRAIHVGTKKGMMTHQAANESVRHATKKEIIEKARRITADVYSKMMIILDAAVHDALGFGFDRRNKLHQKMARQLDCLRSRYVTIADMNQILKKEADVNFVDFDKRDVNFAVHQKHRTQTGITSVFLLSLLDEFCHKSWLKKAYTEAEKISQRIVTGELTFEQLEANLQKKKLKKVAA